MLQSCLRRSFCLAVIFHITLITAFGQTDLITSLNKQSIPISIDPADTNFNDLDMLKPFLKDKMVFGLGEATHGTHEFFAFKHRMLEYLVKEIGVKTFVIEADLAGTQAMNDYVLYGKGDVGKGLNGMGFGVWMTQEVVDMANWIKAYNATQNVANKISFFGCDVQWTTSAMQFLRNYLLPLDQFTAVMEQGFLASQKPAYSITRSDKQSIGRATDELAHLAFNDADTSRAALYKQYVRELQQFINYTDAASAFFPATQSDLRDQYMAENCEWIYNYTGHKKMMIWAHNAHINMSSGSDGYKRMGMFLSKAFKADYYALGFDLYSGKARLYEPKQQKTIVMELPPANPNSTGAIFSQCISPNFILDLKSSSADPLINEFLNRKIASVTYGASFSAEQIPHYVTHNCQKLLMLLSLSGKQLLRKKYKR